ncbi:MAG: glycosyltransferase family 39 protein [Candidatus Peribacteraceae bacterium]
MMSVMLRFSALFRSPLPIATLIAFIYFLVQFSQIAEYGVTWDEPLHRNWGKLFFLYWKTGEFSAISLMPGKGMYYGPLYYLCNYLLSEFLYENGWMRFVAANHVLNIFTVSVGVGLVFLLAKAVSGWRIAASTVVFFVLFPQLIAHAHYNPKDIPLMVGILLSSLFFVRALKTGRRRDFLFASVAFGLAYALKVSAMLMAPVFLVTYLLWLRDRSGISRGLRAEWKTVVCGVVCFALSSYLFWPSAWMHPTLLIESLTLFVVADFWPGKVLFLGTEYAGKDLPFFYTTAEFVMATPILLLFFFVVGALTLLKRPKSPDRIQWIFIVLWVAFPLLLSMKPGLVRYDGIRQFFFILPALMLIAAYGFQQLLELLRNRARSRYAGVIFMTLVLFSLLHQVASVYPFGGSYRNEIVRAVLPEGMDHQLEIEYWGAPYKQGIEWLTLNAEPNPEICVPIGGLLPTWYPWRTDFTFSCTPGFDYLMFITRYSEASETALEGQQPVFNIERMGADLLHIYHIDTLRSGVESSL